MHAHHAISLKSVAKQTNQRPSSKIAYCRDVCGEKKETRKKMEGNMRRKRSESATEGKEESVFIKVAGHRTKLSKSNLELEEVLVNHRRAPSLVSCHGHSPPPSSTLSCQDYSI
ncbi:hypothetical protein CDAR_169941 [Caerostris darwini]|uniref:Uncharacterized protein n=1 Tax=Caerostris darwini TaxID=1538125 RepID=A0AAV4RUE9_9ARAC|nr:hypothetical protein CDAR_169941 [Caerostris darwini]